jgi:hypothetical protein
MEVLMKGRAEKKTKMPVVEQVVFYYSGSDKQFNTFLKAVVKDYIADDRLFISENLIADDKKPSEKSAEYR